MFNNTNLTQNYQIYKTPCTIIYYLPYNYKKFYKFERRLWKPALMHAFFHDYWYFSIFISFFYVISIYLLQRIMNNRKPFQLKNALSIWNCLLAIFSLIATVRMSEEFIFVLNKHTFQESICFSIDPEGPAAFWALLFALSKVAELGDTIFIILRKRPLIFLHWYHHTAVLIFSWHAAQGFTAAGRWFMVMNYFVHSIMYTYYAITSFGIRLPRRLSMLVTSLQTAQMLVGVGISTLIACLKYFSTKSFICQQTNDNLVVSFTIYLSFALLFMNFFRISYLNSKMEKKSLTNDKLITKNRLNKVD